MRRGVLCTFLLAGAVLAWSRPAAAFNPQYDNRATCGNWPNQVELRKSTSGDKTAWSVSDVPNIAYLSSILKDSQGSINPPNDRDMVLRIKNKDGNSFTFVGVKEIYTKKITTTENEAFKTNPAANPDLAGTPVGQNGYYVTGVFTYYFYGSVVINTTTPYATFKGIYYDDVSKKYSFSPGYITNTIKATFPNYKDSCQLKIGLDSYKQLMKAVGIDVGDGEGAKEDTGTLADLGADADSIESPNTVIKNASGYAEEDTTSVCGKPKLKGIMRYAFCLLLDFLVETLVDFI